MLFSLYLHHPNIGPSCLDYSLYAQTGAKRRQDVHPRADPLCDRTSQCHIFDRGDDHSVCCLWSQHERRQPQRAERDGQLWTKPMARSRSNAFHLGLGIRIDPMAQHRQHWVI